MFANNRVCSLLKIKYPIFQGAMAWISEAKLAAAVSNAGGLGIIAGGSRPCDQVEEDLCAIKQLTDKPYGLNIMLGSPYKDEITEMAAEYRVPVITCGAGKPDKVIEKLKAVGSKVFPVISSLKHARAVAALGADGVVAEGCESGGHVGKTTTMVLIPEVVGGVEIPVIAAGGIINGRSMCASFALGAEGVQMGTRFICAQETQIHHYFQQLVIASSDNPTEVTGGSVKHPIRAIKNKLMQELMALEDQDVSQRKLLTLDLTKGKLKLAVDTGNPEQGHYQCGQGCGLVQEVEPAQVIIEKTLSEFSACINSMKKI